MNRNMTAEEAAIEIKELCLYQQNYYKGWNMENSESNIIIKAGQIVGVSLILGLLFDYFFYGKIPGISFPLYVILVAVGLFALTGALKKPVSKDVLWLLLPLVFFSAMVFVRSSLLLTILNIAASLLLLFMITEVVFNNKVKNFLIEDYIKIIFLPVMFIDPLFRTLSDLFSLRGAIKNQKAFSQVIKGIAMAIPVLIVFLLLFSSADLIFQKHVKDLFDIEPETFRRAVFVLIATLVFIGAYSYAFREKEDLSLLEQNTKAPSIGHIETSILLGSINVLFFLFILVQLTYLFGGESNISAQGFTYAEYARRGFFELIAVAVISLLLLLTTEKYITRNEADHAFGFKALSSVLAAQVIVIMISAFTRLSLYEKAYGFTTLRLYSHAFIILLALIFCLLLYKIFKNNKENAFAFHVFISVTLFLTIMNILNPDVFIARRNIERLAVTGRLDVYYLSRLSDDAMPDMMRALSIAKDDLKKSLSAELYTRIQNSDSQYFSKWQSSNLSRMRAEKLLKAKIRELEPYKDYKQQNSDR